MLRTGTLLGIAALALLGVTAAGTTPAPAQSAAAEPGTWQRVAPLPAPRSWHGVAAGPDGRIYVIGGWTTHPEASVLAYTPSDDTWRAVAPLPVALDHVHATLGRDGLIYAFAGAVALRYDPSADVWTRLPAPPEGAQDPGVAAGPDGRVYVIGGVRGHPRGAGPSHRVEAFDPRTNAWTPVTRLPGARSFFPAVTGVNGRIFTLGGASLFPVPTFVLDPGGHAWRRVRGLPAPGPFGGAGARAGDGRIYYMGGTQGSATSRQVYALQPGGATWRAVAPMTLSRAYFAAATGGDGRIYAVGGFSREVGTATATVEAYTPPIGARR